MVSRFTYWSVTSPALRLSLHTLCSHYLFCLSSQLLQSTDRENADLQLTLSADFMTWDFYPPPFTSDNTVVSDRIISTLKVPCQYTVIKTILQRHNLVTALQNHYHNKSKQVDNYINKEFNFDSPLARL